MQLILLLLEVTLAVVFVIAAFAKMFSLDRTRQALADFGVPTRLVPLATPALPFSELVIGALLLPVLWPRPGALAALLLLAVFTVAAGYHLAKGEKIDCNCFGEVQARPIGRRTIVRNALLMLAAAVIVWRGPGAAGLWASAWLAALPLDKQVQLLTSALTLGVLLLGGWYVVHLLREQRALAVRLTEFEGRLINLAPASGLPIGAFAPSFSLPTKAGGVESLQTLLAPRKPLLLFFVHPECGPCGMLLPRVVGWHDTYRERLTVALITTTSQRGVADPPEYQALRTLVEEERAVSKGFQSHSIPSAVLIRPDGTIGSPLARGGAAIENLVNWLTGG